MSNLRSLLLIASLVLFAFVGSVGIGIVAGFLVQSRSSTPQHVEVVKYVDRPAHPAAQASARAASWD